MERRPILQKRGVILNTIRSVVGKKNIDEVIGICYLDLPVNSLNSVKRKTLNNFHNFTKLQRTLCSERKKLKPMEMQFLTHHM